MGCGVATLEKELSCSEMKIVLGWDYFRLVKDFKNYNNYNVKDTNLDVDSHLSTSKPLLLEQVKAQIVQGCDGEISTVSQEAVISTDCSESGGFYFLGVMHIMDEKKSVSVNDLLLLSKLKVEKFCEDVMLPKIVCICFGGSSTRKLSETEVFLDEDTAMRALVSRMSTIWFTSKVCNLSTSISKSISDQK